MTFLVALLMGAAGSWGVYCFTRHQRMRAEMRRVLTNERQAKTIQGAIMGVPARDISLMQLVAMEHESLAPRSIEAWGHPPWCLGCSRTEAITNITYAESNLET